MLVGLVTPLLLTFIYLTFKYKKFGIYGLGAIVVFVMYFLYGEGFVYICNSKLSVFDPFEGGYEFLKVNLKYYWQWYLGLAVTELVLALALKFLTREKQPESVIGQKA